jgi:hypothetical protein
MADPPTTYVSLLFRRRIYRMDPTCLDAGLFPRIHFQRGVAGGSRGFGLPSPFVLFLYLYMTCFISMVIHVVPLFGSGGTSVLGTGILLEASLGRCRHHHLTCRLDRCTGIHAQELYMHFLFGFSNGEQYSYVTDEKGRYTITRLETAKS